MIKEKPDLTAVNYRGIFIKVLRLWERTSDGKKLNHRDITLRGTDGDDIKVTFWASKAENPGFHEGDIFDLLKHDLGLLSQGLINVYLNLMCTEQQH